jgi:uncharacterized protein (TIGR02145 family)
MKQFDIKINQDDIDGMYTVNYFVNAKKFTAKIYNPTGITSVSAVNILQDKLITDPGLRIEVTGNTTSISVTKNSFSNKKLLTFNQYYKNPISSGTTDGFSYSDKSSSFSFKPGDYYLREVRLDIGVWTNKTFIFKIHLFKNDVEIKNSRKTISVVKGGKNSTLPQVSPLGFKNIGLNNNFTHWFLQTNPYKEVNELDITHNWFSETIWGYLGSSILKVRIPGHDLINNNPIVYYVSDYKNVNTSDIYTFKISSTSDFNFTSNLVFKTVKTIQNRDYTRYLYNTIYFAENDNPISTLISDNQYQVCPSNQEWFVTPTPTKTPTKTPKPTITPTKTPTPTKTINVISNPCSAPTLFGVSLLYGSIFTFFYSSLSYYCMGLTLSWSRDQINWINSTAGCSFGRQLDVIYATGTYYFRLTQTCYNGSFNSNIVSYSYGQTPTPTSTVTPTKTPTPTNTKTPTKTPTNTKTPTPTPKPIYLLTSTLTFVDYDYTKPSGRWTLSNPIQGSFMISNWGVISDIQGNRKSISEGINEIGLNNSTEFNLNMVSAQDGLVAPTADSYYKKQNYLTVSVLTNGVWGVGAIYNNGQFFTVATPNGIVTITINISNAKIYFPTITGRIGTVKSGNVFTGGNFWGTSNLDVKTYRNGTIISDGNRMTDSQWLSATEGAWCYPNNRINYDYISTYQNILLDDNFDYLASTNLTYQSTIDYLGDKHQWIPHTTNSGVNPIKIVSTGLTFTLYNQTLSQNSISLNYSGESVYNTFNGTGSNNVYCSFVINTSRLTSVGGRFFSLRESKDGEERGRIFITQITTTTFKFGLSFDDTQTTPQSTSSSTYDFGKKYLVVIKYNKTLSSVSLYVFKENIDVFDLEPTLPTIGPITGIKIGITPNVISFNQGIGVVCLIDGLRVSNIWNIQIDINIEPGYGLLYNSHAVNNVDSGGLAPSGYRIPTSVEWDNLINSLGGVTSGAKMCEMGSKHWINNINFKTSDTVGLCVLPAGNRGINQKTGLFEYEDSFRYSASFWSSKGALNYNRTITINSFKNTIELDTYIETSNGLSVRCVRDDNSVLPSIPVLTTQTTLNCVQYTLNSSDDIGAFLGYYGCYYKYRNCDGQFVSVFVPDDTSTTVNCYPNTSPILDSCY